MAILYLGNAFGSLGHNSRGACAAAHGQRPYWGWMRPAGEVAASHLRGPGVLYYPRKIFEILSAKSCDLVHILCYKCQYNSTSYHSTSGSSRVLGGPRGPQVLMPPSPSLSLSLSLPYRSLFILPLFPSPFSLIPSSPIPLSPAIEGVVERCKLPQRVRAEPGRHTHYGKFRDIITHVRAYVSCIVKQTSAICDCRLKSRPTSCL